MILAILIAAGVPLWLCAAAVLVLVFRNRQLRKRPGNVAVRMRSSPKKRWKPGHSVWVHDVLVYRGSPAAGEEGLFQVIEATARQTAGAERKKLHRIGDVPTVAAMILASGETIEFAARLEHRDRLLGPFAAATRTQESVSA